MPLNYSDRQKKSFKWKPGVFVLAQKQNLAPTRAPVGRLT